MIRTTSGRGSAGSAHPLMHSSQASDSTPFTEATSVRPSLPSPATATRPIPAMRSVRAAHAHAQAPTSIRAPPSILALLSSSACPDLRSVGPTRNLEEPELQPPFPRGPIVRVRSSRTGAWRDVPRCGAAHRFSVNIETCSSNDFSSVDGMNQSRMHTISRTQRSCRFIILLAAAIASLTSGFDALAGNILSSGEDHFEIFMWVTNQSASDEAGGIAKRHCAKFNRKSRFKSLEKTLIAGYEQMKRLSPATQRKVLRMGDRLGKIVGDVRAKGGRR